MPSNSITEEAPPRVRDKTKIDAARSKRREYPYRHPNALCGLPVPENPCTPIREASESPGDQQIVAAARAWQLANC